MTYVRNFSWRGIGRQLGRTSFHNRGQGRVRRRSRETPAGLGGVSMWVEVGDGGEGGGQLQHETAAACRVTSVTKGSAANTRTGERIFFNQVQMHQVSCLRRDTRTAAESAVR